MLPTSVAFLILAVFSLLVGVFEWGGIRFEIGELFFVCLLAVSVLTFIFASLGERKELRLWRRP